LTAPELSKAIAKRAGRIATRVIMAPETMGRRYGQK